MSTILGNFTTTEAANVSLQTLGTNSMIVKCKLDVYLMSTMLENYATAEMTNASLQTLGTNSMIVTCKLDIYLMFTMLKNCFASVTVPVSSQILGTNRLIAKGKVDVYLMSTLFENCASTKTAKVSLQTLGTKSMHSYTTMWCSSKSIPIFSTASKQIDVYMWNTLTKEGTNYHLSLRYQVTTSDPSSKQAVLKTLDVYRWTFAAKLFIPLVSVRSNPKVARILTTMWAIRILIISVVYTATNRLYKHHLSPGHRLSSSNPGNVQITPRTLDVYESRTKLQN